MEHIPTEEIVTGKQPAKSQPAPKYKWLSFIAKVTLICNVCFLLCIVLSYTKDIITIQSIKGTIIILGFIVSFILNIFLQITMLIFRITKKETGIQPWIRIFNVAAFAIQIIVYFFIG